LQADIRYLATVWAAIQQRHAEQPAPAVLYSEHDLPLRIVRDVAGNETKRIVTDDKQVHESIQSFVERFVADPKPNTEYYEEPLPVFERYGLESQINANLERKVWLKSGGSLVIDKSEALTAIDVNTGRFVGKRDLEETVLKTNLEAVGEVVHQLRFRNLGGLIIIDLIDMESAGNREKVYRALQDALRADKSRTNILKISELGLVEMTRKRTRENLVQTLCEPCGYCEGRSYVLSPESVAFRALREIRKHVPRLKGRPIAVAVNPHVAEELLTHAKAALAKLNEEIGASIEVRARPGLHQEQFELTVLEPGPPAEIELSWLRDRHPDAPKTEDETSKTGGRRRSRGGRGRSRRSEAAESSASSGADQSDSESVDAPLAAVDGSETDVESAAVKSESAVAPGPRVLAAAAISANAAEDFGEDLEDDDADEAKQDGSLAADAAEIRPLASGATATDGSGAVTTTEDPDRPGGDSDGSRNESLDEPAKVSVDAAAGEGTARNTAETPQTVDSETESRIISRSE
jgi:hypothetical protein